MNDIPHDEAVLDLGKESSYTESAYGISIPHDGTHGLDETIPQRHIEFLVVGRH